MTRIAFAGFRHAHIFDLYHRAAAHPDMEVAGTWEDDVAASLLPGSGISRSCHAFEDLFATCDAVAIGDCYGRRGSLVIRALRAGKHVLSDKPLCTSTDELGEIESLVREKGLRVGLILDLRDSGNFIALRDVVLSGRIGEVQTAFFSAQHSLLWGKRPAWYFEPGMHGGTLNDIGIHAMDFLPWLTGLEIAEIVAARSWNAKAPALHFFDCGQMMLRLSNGGGVLGDVSYLAPDTCGYASDNYWRVAIHGTRGCAETSFNTQGVIMADDASKEPERLPSAPPRSGGYLEDFLADVNGAPREDGLDTDCCLRATRLALGLERKAKTS
jgi:predicted dehydrogenase